MDTREIIVNGRKQFVEFRTDHDQMAVLSYEALKDLAGFKDSKKLYTITWHTIGTNDGGTITPEQTFIFGIGEKKVVVFNVADTSNA